MGSITKSSLCKALLAVHFFLLLLGAGIASAQEPAWFKGNTHAHTSNSDGEDAPEVVAAWYRSRGYDFLCITDHNTLTPPASITLPPDGKKDLLLIPSEEITGNVHATAMNIGDRISRPWIVRTLPNTIQKYVQWTHNESGTLIVNHPNDDWTLSAKDIRPAQGLLLFEIYNGHPRANNAGDAAHPSTESLWDALLTDGMRIHGVASDDAHSFTRACSPAIASPGRGWIMVKAPRLSPECIVEALTRGDFYSTDGVVLKRVEASASQLSIEIDKDATEAELSHGSACGWPAPEGSKTGVRIDFIGPGGAILQSTDGLSSSYLPHGESYVRARAVLTRTVGEKNVEFCAWSQPVFAK